MGRRRGNSFFIALSLTKDGLTQIKRAVADLIDQRPTTVKKAKPDDLPERICGALEGLPWVREVTVRLREEGHAVAGEVYIVPVEENIGVDQLQEAVERAQQVDWRVYDIVATAVTSLENKQHFTTLHDSQAD